LFKGLVFLKVLICKNGLGWLKVTVKTSIMLHKISVSNKCCSFYIFYSSKNGKKMYHCFHKNFQYYHLYCIFTKWIEPWWA